MAPLHGRFSCRRLRWQAIPWQVAEELFISGKTVSVHATNILAKLGVHSRLEAAARARELGLDRPPESGRR
jgi:DNA-binding CsgD family transcriptional regulator